MSDRASRERNHREYRKIPSTKLQYEISADGRIVRNVKSKKVLQQKLDRYGYRVVCLTYDGKKHYPTVHKLVAECWLGDRPDGLQIDHIDHNKDNNDWHNLRYVTAADNIHNRVTSCRMVEHNRAIAECGKYCTVDGQPFKSCTAAARYLAELHCRKVDTLRYYFKQRRNYILGHRVQYAETVH